MRAVYVTMIAICCYSALAVEPQRRKKEIDPKLADLVAKIDAKAEEIGSMRASFLQRREISLMKEPVEQKGTFSIRRPDGMRFDFAGEEDMTIVVTNEDVTYLSNAAKEGEVVPIKKRQGRYVQRLLDDKMASLMKYFDIRFLDADAGYRLQLLPAKRRLEKRFGEIQVWVDDAYLITRIRVLMSDGDIYELFLSDMELNAALPEDYFRVEIPADYTKGERFDFIIGEQR